MRPMHPIQPRRPVPTNDGCLPTVLLVASLVPLSIIHGAVLMKLWEWFIADPFDVREIGLPLAVGLTSIVTALTIKPDDHADIDPWVALGKVWGWRLLTAAILLGEGLIVSRFV